MALVYIIFGFFDYANEAKLVEYYNSWTDPTAHPPDPVIRTKVLHWTIPTVMLSISLGLTCSIIYLFVQMHRHFNMEVMMAEEARVRTIFLVYIIAYISRLAMYFVQHLWIWDVNN